MARIRTVKPEFYRHELLQELEVSHPDARPMLVYSALWGHCDKQGVFDWRPKQLALDILPFLWEGSIGEALENTLMLLRENGLIILMLHGEKQYGFIPSFKEHQRVSGKEAQEASKHPELVEMTEVKHEGSNGEATGKQQGRQEGKGKEGKGKDTKADIESIPYHGIIDAYNKFCPSLHTAMKLTPARRVSIKARWNNYKDHPGGPLLVFDTLFKKAEASDFLSGRNGRWNGAGLDWLLNETNMVKVIEGNFDNKEQPPIEESSDDDELYREALRRHGIEC